VRLLSARHSERRSVFSLLNLQKLYSLATPGAEADLTRTTTGEAAALGENADGHVFGQQLYEGHRGGDRLGSSSPLKQNTSKPPTHAKQRQQGDYQCNIQSAADHGSPKIIPATVYAIEGIRLETRSTGRTAVSEIFEVEEI
jgi:hypothetical protein